MACPVREEAPLRPGKSHWVPMTPGSSAGAAHVPIKAVVEDNIIPRRIVVKSNRVLVLVLATAALLTSCSVSSESYVAEISGYSVTRGRIMRIENLHANAVQPLQDGVAITLSRPGCLVTIRFDNDESRVMKTGRGVIIVHGYANDYILESELGVSGDGEADAAEAPAAPGTRR